MRDGCVPSSATVVDVDRYRCRRAVRGPIRGPRGVPVRAATHATAASTATAAPDGRGPPSTLLQRGPRGPLHTSRLHTDVSIAAFCERSRCRAAPRPRAMSAGGLLQDPVDVARHARADTVGAGLRAAAPEACDPVLRPAGRTSRHHQRVAAVALGPNTSVTRVAARGSRRGVSRHRHPRGRDAAVQGVDRVREPADRGRSSMRAVLARSKAAGLRASTCCQTSGDRADNDPNGLVVNGAHLSEAPRDPDEVLSHLLVAGQPAALPREELCCADRATLVPSRRGPRRQSSFSSSSSPPTRASSS